MRWRLALRNILRQYRRSSISVLMIAGAIASIILVEGVSRNMLEQNKEGTIHSQYGHLQIANLKAWSPSAKDSPKDHSFLPDPAMIEKLQAINGVESVSERVSFFGILSYRSQTVNAMGQGIDPSQDRQMLSHLKMRAGRNLDPSSKFELLVGAGLQKKLGLEIGSPVTLLSQTYDGSFNAVDFEVVGVFTSGLDEIDNITVYLPLVSAQRLLDTDQVERLVVNLLDTEQTELVKREVASVIDDGYQVKSWSELGKLYQQVRRYVESQSLIVSIILSSLALLAIANTVGSSIAERTGEIGTIRALGSPRSEVFQNFLMESLMIGLAGGICGILLGFGAAAALKLIGFRVEIPGTSQDMPLVVEFSWLMIVKTLVIGNVVAVCATLFPAWRASRLSIVDALRKNI